MVFSTTDRVATTETQSAKPGFWPNLRRWIKADSIARRMLLAGFVILLTSTLVLTAATYRALNARADAGALQVALDVQEDVHVLNENIADFRLAAVDLINDGNGGHDALDRQKEMAASVDAIEAIFPAISNAVGSPQEMRHWNATIADLPKFKALVLSSKPSDAQSERNAAEDRLEDYNEELATLGAAIEERALARRKAIATEMREQIREGFFQIGLCSLIALFVGMMVFGGIMRDVIPPARGLKNATRRMAEGELDVVLPESQFSELRELAAAIESFRATSKRDREVAYVDFASGLPNRRAFTQAIARFDRNTRAAFALIDVDRFKRVNDDFGHLAGDKLVSELGARLLSILPTGSFIARFGGDEFAAYIPLPKSESSHMVAERIVRESAVPFEFDNILIAATVSVGITEINGRDFAVSDFSAIIREADLALYAAKGAGRNRSTCFDSSLTAEFDLNRALDGDLGPAIDEGQLRMVYQPIIAVDGYEQEVEALIRWTHPEMGNVAPDLLIHAAERSGQMVRLGDWILDRALSDLERWPELTMSINLSAVQLQASGFAAAILDRCRRANVAPSRLMFEVTETIAIEQNSNAFLNLGMLRGLGFRIALDDFGAGYSSLWLLKSFQFDRLKLDRSLIIDVQSNEMSKAVFEAAALLGRSLNMEVVAEGVCEPELVAPLEAAGVTHMQGYHYSIPLEADEIEAFYQWEPARRYG